MPELPEVETTLRGMKPVFLNCDIISVDIRRRDLRCPVPENFKNMLTGQMITDMQRRGKYILVFLDNGEGFALHLGMSGRIHIVKPGQIYDLQKHDHLIFETANDTKVIFNDPRRFGMVFSAPVESWQTLPVFARMGPEPLGNHFSDEILRAKLKGRKVSIKNALLDQHIVAGLGNIYVCEALYYAGIHPARPAGTLTEKETGRLVTAIRDVLIQAIEAGGSSLKDYRQADGALGYFQHRFAVYNREGESCPDCTCDIAKIGGVQRDVQSGRSTFYCAKIQS